VGQSNACPSESLPSSGKVNELGFGNIRTKSFNSFPGGLSIEGQGEDGTVNGEARTGITSLPIPSAGMRPILRDCLAVVERERIGARNMTVRKERGIRREKKGLIYVLSLKSGWAKSTVPPRE